MNRALIHAAAALLLTAAAACSADSDGHDGDAAASDATVSGDAPDGAADDDAAEVDQDAAEVRSPLPPHGREVNSACPDYETERSEYVCADLAQAESCSSDADCDDGLCQPQFAVGYSVCSCFAHLCRADADCAPDEACACAEAIPTHVVAQAPACGIFAAGPCQSACLPAECRSNADCEPGGVCAAYRDWCDRLQGWACWDARSAACGSNADCDEGMRCGFDGSAWGCLHDGGICD